MDYLVQALVLIMVLWTHSATPAPRQRRLTLAAPNPSYYYNDIDGQAGTYSFGYDVLDPETGNTQFRSEERYPNGTIVGSYGYIDPRGRSRRYDYIADENGYRLMTEATTKQNLTPKEPVSTEASVSWTRPRRPNKKKKEPVQTPINYLEPPRY